MVSRHSEPDSAARVDAFVEGLPVRAATTVAHGDVERAAFERWASGAFGPSGAERAAITGKYIFKAIEQCWKAWLYRSTLKLG